MSKRKGTKTVAYYYSQKKASSKARGIPFLLSFSEMHWLFYMARITPYDIGKKSHQYALSRFNDSGPYAIGNCRFLRVKDNLLEKKGRKLSNALSKYTYLIEGTHYETVFDIVQVYQFSRYRVYDRVANPNFPDWERIPRQ